VNDQVLTLAEAAKEIKLSEKTLYRRAQKGEGPFFKPAGRWRCYRSELHAWFRSSGTRRPSPPSDPMPRPRRRGSVLDKVVELDERRKAG